MWEDPIVNEMRSAGAKLLASCDNDLKKLAARLRENQSQHADRVVNKHQIKKNASKALLFRSHLKNPDRH